MNNALVNLGGYRSLYDSALFIWYDGDGTVKGIISSHVDDFVYCGSATFLVEVIAKLRTLFKIGEECSGSFKYVGLSIVQKNGEVRISQDNYVKEVESMEVSNCKTRSIWTLQVLCAICNWILLWGSNADQ